MPNEKEGPMKLLSVIILVGLTTTASAQTVSDTDLDTAVSTCRKHALVPTHLNPAQWDTGYEGCGAIMAEYDARQKAKQDSSDFINNLAGKLKQ
jgi:hypothetical protein